MKETALVVMAIGIGNRFGEGIKQLGPVGPGGEIIMDYSTHDTMEAGFNKIIFIIRKDPEKGFKEVIGNRIEKVVPAEHTYRELNALPDGYEVTPEHTRPWGTGQAMLVTKGLVNGPSLVINTDDYHGREGFKEIYNYMVNGMDIEAGVYDPCMGSFVLSNTLSDNGAVTRGACQVNDSHTLRTVNETYNIGMTGDGLQATSEQGNPVRISPDQPVSMDMWGILASFLDELERGFPRFLGNLKEGDIKPEYLPPRIIDDLVQSECVRVTALDTPGKWFEVTYKEDKQAVADAVRKLINAGVYREELCD